MDLIPQQRIELHLHTTASADASVITPGEAIRAASSMGHRAVAITCLNSVQDLPEAERLRQQHDPAFRVICGAQIFWVTPGCREPHPVTVLVKNQNGLNKLYRIISALDENGILWDPDEQLLPDLSGDLLLGSGIGGALYRAVAEEWPEKHIHRLAAHYHYIELFPAEDPQVQAVNRALFALGERLDLPVVAVGKCHYIAPEDQICKNVLLAAGGCPPETVSTHLRTTEEMLRAFAYLGAEAAYRVVVTDPNRIVDQVGPVDPTAGVQLPLTLPDAREALTGLCHHRLEQLYGAAIPPQINTRLETELELIVEKGYDSLFLLVHRILKPLHDQGACTGARGTVGSTLVAWLLDISDVNPLPPHYRCPGCRHTVFAGEAVSGYDLPAKKCPRCGADMLGDGHGIPYETCIGRDGENAPDIDISIPVRLRPQAIRQLTELVGTARLAFAGAVRTTGHHLARSYLDHYRESQGLTLSQERSQWILSLLAAVKKCDDLHPGGITVLPEGMEFEAVTPLQKLNAPVCGIDRVTHMNHFHLQNTLPKIDIFPHSGYDRLNALFQRTGILPEQINYSDDAVYRFFREEDPSDLPGFSGDFIRRLLRQIRPEKFSDLVKLLGMCHGTDTWENNAAQLIGEHPLQELIGDRDDVFMTLRQYGARRESAYSAMRTVRMGRFRNYPLLTGRLRDAGVPQWYILSMQKIRYLSAKAHIVACVQLAYRLAWFRLYFPEEYESVSQD